MRLPLPGSLFRWVSGWLQRPGNFERLLIAVLLAGIAVRAVASVRLPPREDATAYIAEAWALSQGQGFVAPWGAYDNPFSSTPAPTDLAPLYPLYLAGFYQAFGFSIAVTTAAGFLLGVLTLLAAYLAGKDLFGHQAGLLTAAVLASLPSLVFFPAQEFSENLPVLLLIVALWALIRALRDDRPVHYLVAGLAAAGFALTKAQGLSLTLVLAAAAGVLAWRLWERGRTVLFHPGTWALLAGFLLPLLAWFSAGPRAAPPVSVEQPGLGEVAVAVGAKTFTVLYVLAFVFVFFLPELRRARRAWATEEGRLLWAAGLGLAAVVWVMIIVQYASGEPGGGLWHLEQGRHLIPAFVPLLWLLVLSRKDEPDPPEGWPLKPRVRRTLSGSFLLAAPIATRLGSFVGDGLFWAAGAASFQARPLRTRATIYFVLAFLVLLDGAGSTIRTPPEVAGEWLQDHVQPGDVIAVDPWTAYGNGTRGRGPGYKYELFPYVGDRASVVPYDPSVNATYLLSYVNDSYAGYDVVLAIEWRLDPGPISLAWNGLVGQVRRLAGGTNPPPAGVPDAWLFARTP